MAIFQKSVLMKYIRNLDEDKINKAYKEYKEYYGDVERQANIRALKEENYQEGFLREIFVDVLGYTINPDKGYNLTTEYKNEVDARKTDGAILKDGEAIAVIELKSTKTVDMKSIENQAFNYKRNQKNCQYVITSNFEWLNFYIGDYSVEYEEFNLFNMSLEDFKKFYITLSKDSIFNVIPIKIKDESKLKEIQVTKDLYNDYAQLKRKLFDNLVKNNSHIDKLTLLKKSQKLLDRVLFFFFAEDRGLLPPNMISKIIDEFNHLKELDAYQPLYSIYCKYLQYVDSGAERKDFKILGYNGELFKPDEILDKLKIDDHVLNKDVMKISSYDFSNEVDVDILGHIFENSLNDIEELHAEVEGKEFDKPKTKRKKEGVFYTPKYITQYIVENTLGTLCEEKKKELKLDNIDLDLTKIYKRLTKDKKDLLYRLIQYRDYLQSLKILDPACGSGAFLIQVLDYLIREHEFVERYRKVLTGDLLGLEAIRTSILEKNIYGVDLNDEAVEISKLSLWLRTAERGRKLNDLSEHIKCGNSLINDKEIAGDKAFNWVEELSEIMQNGGFDVVIGNPPYVDTKSIEKDKVQYYKKQYYTAGNRVNTFALFVEISIRLLIDNGKCGMIIHRNLIRSNDYEKCREYILDNALIESILSFGIGVFENVTGEMTVLTFQKSKAENNNIVVHNFNKNIDYTQKPKIINQNIFKTSLGKRFNIYLNPAIIKLLLKIEQNTIKCGEIADTFQGIIAKNEKKDISNKKLKDNYKPIIRGKSINKYCKLKSHEYINYYEGTKVLTRGRVRKIFDLEGKIVTQHISGKITATLDNNKYYYMQTVNGTNSKNKNYSNKYLLALFNSNLLNFYYEYRFNVGAEFTTAVAIDNINLFPIKVISIDKQKTFIKKVDAILNKNASFEDKSTEFLEWLKLEYQIAKTSQKLESFYKFDFDTMKQELKKKIPNGSNLGPKEIGKLKKYFDEYKNELLQLKNEIDKMDIEIDQLVYNLYALTGEEIRTVEDSFNC